MPSPPIHMTTTDADSSSRFSLCLFLFTHTLFQSIALFVINARSVQREERASIACFVCVCFVCLVASWLVSCGNCQIVANSPVYICVRCYMLYVCVCVYVLPFFPPFNRAVEAEWEKGRERERYLICLVIVLSGALCCVGTPYAPVLYFCCNWLPRQIPAASRK